MTDSKTTTGPTAGSKADVGWRPSLLAALLALAGHGLLALWIAVPGSFRKYSRAAEQLLAGELPAERLVDFSPLYFELSLWLERLVPQPERVLEGFQIVLGALSVGLFHALLARRVGAPWAAGVTLLFAIDRHLLVYTRILEPEAILLCCLLAVLVLLDRRGVDAALPAGVLAALALAARPTFLPAFALTPLYFWLRGSRGKPWVVGSLLFLGPVVAMLMLLGSRATAISGVSGTPVMNPGTVFFEGNNPLSHGTSAIYPPMVLGSVRHTIGEPDSAHRHYREVARGSTGETLTIAEVNGFWSGRAGAYLRSEPGLALGLWREKLLRAVHAFRWHDVPTGWRYDQRLPWLLSVPFALLAPLALLGAGIDARRWHQSLLIYALGGLQLAVMLVFYVSARQRLVLLPAVLYFAAVALEALFSRHRDRDSPWTRRRGLVLVALAATSLVLLLPDPEMRDELYRRQGFAATEVQLDRIRALSEQAPLAHHADAVVEAVATAPWWLDWLYPAFFPREQGTLEDRVADALARRRTDPAFPRSLIDSLDFDYSAILVRAGRHDEAEPLLRELIAHDVHVYRGGQQPSHPEILLAQVLVARGDREAAVGELRAFLERHPGDPFALTELYALTEDPAALATLERLWSALDARYLLGRVWLRHDRPERAIVDLGFVAERLPEFRDARIALAAALGSVGRLDEGVTEYLEASRIRPEPIVEPERVVDLFRRWGASRPTDPVAQLTTAQVLHQHGLFRQALTVLDGIADDSPPQLAEPVARERQRLERALAAP